MIAQLFFLNKDKPRKLTKFNFGILRCYHNFTEINLLQYSDEDNKEFPGFSVISEWRLVDVNESRTNLFVVKLDQSANRETNLNTGQ